MTRKKYKQIRPKRFLNKKTGRVHSQRMMLWAGLAQTRCGWPVLHGVVGGQPVDDKWVVTADRVTCKSCLRA